MTSLGIQVHGGYGYIEETGAAQHLRDSRISPIYEGTNGIQAIDLVGRKLQMNEGKVIRDLLDEIRDFTEGLNQQGEEFETIMSNLTDSLQAVEEATVWLAEKGTEDPIQAISGATPYLRMLGQLVGGWFLARFGWSGRPCHTMQVNSGGWVGWVTTRRHTKLSRAVHSSRSQPHLYICDTTKIRPSLLLV